MEILFYSENFRGAPNGWTPVDNATFLVGENSTGKSSFGMLGEIVLSSSFITSSGCSDVIKRLDSFDDFWSKMSGAKSQDAIFTIGILWRAENNKTFGKVVSYYNDNGDVRAHSVSIIRGAKIRKVFRVENSLYKIERTAKKTVRLQALANQLVSFHEQANDDADVIIDGDKEERTKYPALLLTLIAEQEITKETESATLSFTPDSFPFGAKIHSFGPMRSKPERVHMVGKNEFDSEGATTITRLKKSLSEGRFYNSLKKFGKASGLYDDIKVVDITKQIGRNSFVIKFTKTGIDFFPDELGYGLSQVMPLITDTLMRSKASFVIIQQPELHLHPKAQAAFGDVLFEYANKGGFFLVETHSDFVIDRYRLGMAKSRKKNKPKSQVLFFYSGQKANRHDCIKIADDGAYINPKPRFRDFFLKEQMRVLDAL
ncbi:AAA family ATPase [Hyphococcus sp.]|uniref:AAA family ATPase n=1 Tax=Hyphococcus sp. TaxID=2038636 RepID=UPI0035C7124C